MNKRGQVTIFVILGIVIVLILAIVFLVYQDTLKITLGRGEKQKFIAPQVQAVNDFVLDCLEIKSKEGLYQIGQQGGYYNVPKESSIVYFTEDVPYYYLNENKYVPSLGLIERELTNYLSDNLNACLNFTVFREAGVKINTREYSILTKIDDKSVDIKMKYLLVIEKSNSRFSLEDFQFIINSNLKTLQTVSEEIINDYAKKPGFVCLTCLEDLSKENNVTIKSIPVSDVSVFENDIIWFLITDKEYSLDDKDLTLRFVVEQ